MTLGQEALMEILTNPDKRPQLVPIMNRVGYTEVANPQRKDGRWRVGGKLETIYARKALSYGEQLQAARKLVEERRTRPFFD